MKQENKEDKIIIKNLAKTFGTKNVLYGVNINVQNGKSLVIIGGSGSGKSVLLKCITGLLTPDKGSSITIDDKDYATIPISKRFNKNLKIGMLFQGNALFDSLNIWQNITFGVTQKRNITNMEARDIAKDKLQMVELSANILDLYPAEISGGMQKRVALARAIAHDPKLIFFDEPTSGLDPVTSNKISTLIRNVSTSIQATTITITHDVRCMEKIADSVAVITNRTTVLFRTLDELFKTDDPYIKDFTGRA